jgi:hypothetical protein
VHLLKLNACLLQVGFTMCVTGGRLAEELLEMLPVYLLTATTYSH